MFDPFAYADERGVRWVERELPEPLLGMYVVEADLPPTIVLSPILRGYPRLRRSVMGEELGHHETGVGFNAMSAYFTYQDALRVGRVEHRARRWAALQFMPEDELCQLMMQSEYGTLEDLAEYFDVITALVRLRMTIFASDHGVVVPLETHMMRLKEGGKCAGVFL